MCMKHCRRSKVHLFTTKLAVGSHRRRRRGQCRRQHAVRGIGGLASGAEEDTVEDAEEAPLEQGNAVVEPSPEGGGTAEFRIKVGLVLFVFLLLLL